MSDASHLISMIKKRPGMFLRTQGLFELRAFLTGYEQRLAEEHGNHFYKCPDLKKFNEFVRKKYEITDGHEWENIIQYYSVNDMDALQNFFKLWDEFMHTYSDNQE